jgi:DNA helicase HerA-like ATPase
MAGHILIAGASLTGKTTLAQLFARDFEKQGVKLAVRDPVDSNTAGGGWPKSALRFNDDYSFLEWMHSPAASNYVVFIDEAPDILSVKDKGNHWMLRKGRHFGLSMVVIATRPLDVAPTVRNNCHYGFMFRLAKDDMREVMKDFGHSDLHTIELDAGEFIAVKSGHRAFTRGNVFKLAEGPKGNPP